MFTDRDGNRRGINRDYWYYTDREGDIYGPFETETMKRWFH